MMAAVARSICMGPLGRRWIGTCTRCGMDARGHHVEKELALTAAAACECPYVDGYSRPTARAGAGA